MRTRAPLAGLLLALVLVFVGPAAANAQSSDQVKKEAKELAEKNGGKEADVNCIGDLIDGKRVDDCHKAPSPILPPTNELIWGAISFVAVFLLLWKFGWPGIKAGMNARTERIKSDLDQAEAARTEAEGVLTEYQAQVADAKGEAARIIEDARQTADAMKRDLQAQAEADIAAQRSKAASDIEAAKAQALADLRGEVATIAIGAAERVVERNLDPETNKALVESFIDQVGAGRN